MKRSSTSVGHKWHMMRSLSACACVSLTLVFSGCGGGGGSGSQGPPPGSPAFQIVASPASPAVAPGTSSVFQVSIVPQNGFSGAVGITTSGLPSGIMVAPSSFTIVGTPQAVTLTVNNSISVGNYSLTLSGTSGSVANSATIAISVGPLPNFLLIQPLVSQVVARFGETTQSQFQTLAQGQGAAAYLLNFSTSALPQGVTATFSPNPIQVGQTTTMSVTAPSSAQWSQGTPFSVIATPTAALSAKSVSMDLVVAPPPGNIPNTSTSYLRTDETPRSIVYDAAHQLLFASEFFLNRVDVVSTTTRQLVKSVPILTPAGLALTADSSEVLVGSDAQQVQAISTTSLEIVKKWALPLLGGGTYGIQTPWLLADGTVAFRPSGYGILSEDLAIWNPTNNTVSTVSLPSNLANQPCMLAAGAKGTKIVVASCGGPGLAFVYDAATKTTSNPINFPGFVYSVAASPDGSAFIISDDTNGIGLYDSQLNPIRFLTPPDGHASFMFSSDGLRIYMQVGLLLTFDNVGNFLSEAPTLGSIPPGSQLSPCPYVETPFAVDSNGIVFGAADHGIAFDDSTYSVHTLFGFGGGFTCLSMVPTPTVGPVNAATPISFPSVAGFGSLPDVWFGGVRASQASLNPGVVGSLNATVPPSSVPGSVDIKIITPDGSESYSPLAFSYGPNLMFVSGNTSAPGGGGTSYITGLGLPADPTQIQVAVGGKAATVISAVQASFNSITFPYAYPYPAVELKVTLPPGSGDEDVVVTTSAGSSTLPKAIHYLASVTDYSSPDTFQAVLLDRRRNQLYLSAGDHIDVFSLGTLHFSATFTPPSLGGQKAFHGLALTPDGTKLLAANFPDGSLAIINPDQPSAATAVQIVPPGTFENPGAENVVATNTGLAFVGSKTTQSAGCGAPLYQLDLSTMAVTTISSINAVCIQPEGFPIAASEDGSKVVLTTTDISGNQEVALYDAASKSWVTNSVLENFGGNAAISANGTVFATGSGLVDAKANLLGYLAWQDVFESHGGFPSLGLEKVSEGGSLVYIPFGPATFVSGTYPGFLDIFDVNHGALLLRLILSEQVQAVTNGMAIDASGQNIFLITNAGLTIAQLNSAPLAIGSITPVSPARNSTITILGSGFAAGTTVAANGIAATPTFVDSNTLRVVVPNLAAGAVQLTVANPGGDTYTLDNVFTLP